MNNLIIIVDSLERARFFKRLHPEILKNKSTTIITSEPLVYLNNKLSGINCDLITLKNFKYDDLTDMETTNNIEYLNNDISINESKRIYLSAYNLILSKLLSKKDRVVMWNGQQILCRAATRAALEIGCNTTYLEISNLPSKLFSDSLGVNANSSIAKNIEKLDGLKSVNEIKHKEWVNNYEFEKTKTLPQSRSKKTNLLISLLNSLVKKTYKSV
ncbi:MAG: hypothetical protein ABF331_02715, partial [Hellea sp.]